MKGQDDVERKKLPFPNKQKLTFRPKRPWLGRRFERLSALQETNFDARNETLLPKDHKITKKKKHKKKTITFFNLPGFRDQKFLSSELRHSKQVKIETISV